MEEESSYQISSGGHSRHEQPSEESKHKNSDTSSDSSGSPGDSDKNDNLKPAESSSKHSQKV